jgi:hypothetical protein
MNDDIIKVMDLGLMSEQEKQKFNSDINNKKMASGFTKKARELVKAPTCLYCDREVTSFCNSHSVPRFCLENIATQGEVLTLNAIVDNPLIEREKGIKKAGTFQLICNDCDSKIFSDYENPDNYVSKPSAKMIAQMALKNSLKSISKRLFEIELFNLASKISETARSFTKIKNEINEIDLKEYEKSYKKAKRAIEKNSTSDYYICYYEKLDYIVPIAFQASLAMVMDFEGNIINDIYNPSSKYVIQNIHISILPLKTETVIVMFIEDGDTRYRRFYKQFNKLPLEDKLAALTYIIFLYSEDIYFAKSIEKEVIESQALCGAGRTTQDMFSPLPFLNPLETLKDSHDLNKRHEIPNLLSEKYKL